MIKVSSFGKYALCGRRTTPVSCIGKKLMLYYKSPIIIHIRVEYLSYYFFIERFIRSNAAKRACMNKLLHRMHTGIENSGKTYEFSNRIFFYVTRFHIDRREENLLFL